MKDTIIIDAELLKGWACFILMMLAAIGVCVVLEYFIG